MSIVCLGLNHRTAPVEVRERVAFSASHLGEALRSLTSMESLNETVVLSTCNRVEIYAAGEQAEVALDTLFGFLRDSFGLEPGHADEFYRLQDEAAAKHLFSVASGLDSMVLGETEIFGQVKEAYATAHAEGACQRGLNKLFQQAFQVGKLVRSSTQITRGSTSVGAVAVDLAEKIFGDLAGCQVMVIGAGDMSRRVGMSLKSRGASGIIVSNRSFDKAEELASEMDGHALRFDDWPSEIHKVDILISSTSAPHTILHPDTVEKAMANRSGRSLFCIDIAVPRDIEPAINELENVYLYDIDNLETIAARARGERERQIAVCNELIDRHISEKGIPALELYPQSSSARRQEPSSTGPEALPQS